MNYRVRVASVYLLGFFIDLVNMFIANVAYPEIGRHFAAPVSELAWISNGYILGLTLVIPGSSWLAKRIGAKRVFMLSLLVFMVGTAGVAASSAVSQLIAWRCLQGAGGGMLIPIGQTLAYALYPRHQRAKLSSAVMLIALLAPALSPALGGVLVDSVSWRGVFLVSLPLAGLALILAGCWLKPDRKAQITPPFDLFGLLTACCALIQLMLGLTFLGEKNHLLAGGLLLLSGILVMTIYVRNALKKAHPLLNLRLLKDPLLQTAMLVYQLIPGVFTGVNLIAMFYLQDQLGMPASSVGALMLPWAMASAVAISLTGKRFNRSGPRPLFITGCLVQGLGIGLLAMTADAAEVLTAVTAFTLMGFGGSLCSSTAQSAAFLQIAEQDLADASALWNINRQLSFCAGVTLISLMFTLIAGTGLPSGQVWTLCFLLAAFSAIIPLACCLRINNPKIIFTLHQEQK
ncbi:MFS transporter [Phytobacter sp. AG2a]